MNLKNFKKFSGLNRNLPISVVFFLIMVFAIDNSLQAQTTSDVRNYNKNELHTNIDKEPQHQNLKLVSFTNIERDKINNPTEGMVIFNSTHKKPQFYDGTSWKFFNQAAHYIGESYGGGIIFYLDETGEHGLISAQTDQSTGAEWGYSDKQSGATAKTIGRGQENTNKIVDAISTQNIAARLCNDLQLNGYSDWFLPSREEVDLLYQNLKLKNLANLNGEDYWSSSETDFNNAWLLNFHTGMVIEQNVKKKAHVRAIRSF